MLDISSLFGLFLLVLIGFFTYKVYVWPYYISPLRKIPGPSFESVFLGNFKTLFTEEAGEPQLRWIKKYGKVVRFHEILNKPNILIADTKIIQEISSSQVYDFAKPYNLDIVSIAGNGLVFAEGEDHKRQRKMMSPAFNYNNVKEMLPSFNKVALTLKTIIDNKLNEGESDIILTPYISKATLDAIGLVGFNYEINSLEFPNELADAYDVLTRLTSPSRLVLSFLSNYFPFIRKLPLSQNKRFEDACRVIRRISKELVEKRYQDDENNKLDGKDLLSLLISINKTLPPEEKMTKKELQYQVMTIMVAGHATTNITVCWALYLLAINPRDQDLLREELVKEFPDKSKFNPTFDNINSLEYLNCVVKEILRLYSPVVSIRRLTTKDKVFDGYFIPKDTIIHVAISALHRLPSIWGPTADDFDPKRWLDPSLIKDVSNLNYLPFYTGTRNCIGNKVAVTEIKILISILIRNFVFKPIEGFHIRKSFTPVVALDPYLKLNVSRVEA